MSTEVQEPREFKRKKIKLDDHAVEIATQHFPEEAREMVLWLAGFTRENCGGQIAKLQEACREFGNESDYATWHKIFTGRYFLPDPERPGRVIGSVDNFLRTVEELKKVALADARSAKMPFVETHCSNLIFDFLDKKLQPGRVNKFGGIVGYTGMQKSASFKEYRTRNNHGKVVHIEAPAEPRISQFIDDLAKAYGFEGGSRVQKKNKITETVNRHKTIIVDNVQRLYNESNGSDQPIFNLLQKMQDDTGCTIIFSYTPDFHKLLTTTNVRMGYFEQFIGRMGGLRKALVLPNFPTRDDVLPIAKAFKLTDATAHVKYLEKISQEPGRIRALFDDLQDAKQLAEMDGKALTIDHIRLARDEEDGVEK